MRDEHQELRDHGVQVVAVSPDSTTDSDRLARELDLPYVLLSDAGRRVAAAFGVVSGDAERPGAFLLDRQAQVRWSYVGGDPSDQPSPATVLAVVSGRAQLGVPAPSSVLTPLVSIVVAAVFLSLGVLARTADQALLGWDVPVRDAVLELGRTWFGPVVEGASRLGSRWLIAALMIPMVLVAWARCRQLAVVLIAAFPSGLALELLLKAVVDRPRPALGAGFGSSFPSGHVLAAAAFWGLVPPWIYLVTRRRWAWAVSAGLAGVALVLVGLNRVLVGAHWPSDVVGGYLGGAVFLVAAEWAVRQPSRALRCEACDLHPLRRAPEGSEGRPPGVTLSSRTARTRLGEDAMSDEGGDLR